MPKADHVLHGHNTWMLGVVIRVGSRGSFSCTAKIIPLRRIGTVHDGVHGKRRITNLAQRVSIQIEVDVVDAVDVTITPRLDYDDLGI